MKRHLQKSAIWIAVPLLCVPGAADADFPDVEAEIVSLLKDHPGQGRADMVIDPKLSAAAQAKADDMKARSYTKHTDPDGCGPNFLVQWHGYFLPAKYSNAKDGNNIESLVSERGLSGLGFLSPDAARTVANLIASDKHRAHVLAEKSFFAAQTRVGVGISRDEENDSTYYVFFSSAPPAPTDVLSPLLDYEWPKAKSRANKVMFHRGTVFDTFGIETVQFRLAKRAWQVANFSPEDGRWSGRTVLRRAFYKKVRKGRRAVVVQVRVQDRAGNWSQTSRVFKSRRR